MTLPGDSLNHVHIRSERVFDFALPDVCAHACIHPCICMCVLTDPSRYGDSFVFPTDTQVNPETSWPVYRAHTQQPPPNQSSLTPLNFMW